MAVVDVRHDISKDEYEVYSFYSLDMCFVFDQYVRYVRPAGKRKFVLKQVWRRIMGRDNTVEEPVIPEWVKVSAKSNAEDLVTIKTWSEYKNR